MENIARDPPVIGRGLLPHDLTSWGMFLSADIVVKAVIVGLALASVVTWTIWLAKNIELLIAKRALRRGIDALEKAASPRSAREGEAGGVVEAFLRASAEEIELSGEAGGGGLKERIVSRLERIEVAAGRRMARGTGLLATIGATAPFVGLFGTLWGIMNSFVGISRAQTTNLAVVAPGIAEALLATAVGLVAAIPAVVIYNVFARAIAGYRALLGDAAASVLRIIGRDLDHGSASGLKATE